MREMREITYQKEFIESDSYITIGNFSRGGGKTFSVALKIVRDKPKNAILFASNTRILGEALSNVRSIGYDNKEITFMSILNIGIVINFVDGKTTHIALQRSANSDKIYDMAIYEDSLPYVNSKYKAKKHVSTVTMNANLVPCYYNEDVKVINAGIKEMIKNKLSEPKWIEEYRKNKEQFIREFDILNEYDCLFTDKPMLDKDQWIDDEINKLMVEFSNIPKEENTTKRRELVLNMIIKLEQQKRYK